MQLTEKQIEKFQQLWKNRFGCDISRKEAFAQGIKLVRLMELVYKPMTLTEHDTIQMRRAVKDRMSNCLTNGGLSDITSSPIARISNKAIENSNVKK